MTGPHVLELSPGRSVPLEQTSKWRVEPSAAEVLIVTLASFAVFVVVLSLLKGFFTAVDGFGDNRGYMGVAAAIRHWDFHGLNIKQFWGLSYLMALLSMVTRVSDRTALLLASWLPSIISVLFARRLWNGWVACFFAVINFYWLQLSLLGGSEPLFVALLFAAFLAIRSNRWLLAVLLASLATTVRPLGFLCLVALGVALLWRREWRRFALALLIGVTVGLLYIAPLALYVGDPLATVHSYEYSGSQGPPLFGIPFYAIIKGTFLYPSPWTNLVWTSAWILLVLAGIVAMFATAKFRQYARVHPVEIIFTSLYLVFIFSYNFPYWARGNFPRFAIPVVPLVLLALQRWLPKDRRLVWALAALTPALAAVSAVGLSNVIGRLHTVMR
ncbi:MAG: hypothetical protein LAO03_16765 [Acidobacteriia bacterium]|nr:hypothetical protein [Terriglobia bacterium]